LYYACSTTAASRTKKDSRRAVRDPYPP
jgi:hypothetical protein